MLLDRLPCSYKLLFNIPTISKRIKIDTILIVITGLIKTFCKLYEWFVTNKILSLLIDYLNRLES